MGRPHELVSPGRGNLDEQRGCKARCLVRGTKKLSSALLGSPCWSNGQIHLRQVNKGKYPNLISAVQMAAPTHERVRDPLHRRGSETQ